MTTELLRNNLEQAGWKVFPCWKTSCVALYKTFQGRAECHCNTGKNKQAEIYLTAFHAPNGDFYESVEIEVHGQLADESWIKIQLHGLELRADAQYYEDCTNFALDVWDFSHSRK